MRPAPYIERTTDERRLLIEDAAAMLLKATKTHGMTITADERVSEKDTAQLLGYSAGSLKNMRQEGKAPHHYKRGVGGGRISYRLMDIATWIEDRREGW